MSTAQGGPATRVTEWSLLPCKLLAGARGQHFGSLASVVFIFAPMPVLSSWRPCGGIDKLPGCTAAVPTACVTAAQASYAGNAQLQQLAVASLTNFGCYVQNGGILTTPAYGTIGNAKPEISSARQTITMWISP